MRRIRCWMLSFVVIFSYFAGVNAQDLKLVESAKKEGGKVVVYGSIENDTMDLIAAAFKKRTGLEVDFWRSSSPDADKIELVEMIDMDKKAYAEKMAEYRKIFLR